MLLAEAGYDEARHNDCIESLRRKGGTISAVIEELAGHYVRMYGLGGVEEINWGMCEDFAEDVCRLVPGAYAAWDDELGGYDGALGCHKMIVYGGRYYDSECPEGTEEWEDLIRNRQQ